MCNSLGNVKICCFRFAMQGIILCMRLSQWDMAFYYNAISHWLGAYTEWSVQCQYIYTIKCDNLSQHRSDWCHTFCLPYVYVRLLKKKTYAKTFRVTMMWTTCVNWYNNKIHYFQDFFNIIDFKYILKREKISMWIGRNRVPNYMHLTWWRHQMETFSALLAICAGNSSVPGELPAQRPVTRSFDVFFDLRLNKRLSKHWWDW